MFKVSAFHLCLSCQYKTSPFGKYSNALCWEIGGVFTYSKGLNFKFSIYSCYRTQVVNGI